MVAFSSASRASKSSSSSMCPKHRPIFQPRRDVIPPRRKARPKASQLSAAYPQSQKRKSGRSNSDLLRTNSQAAWTVDETIFQGPRSRPETKMRSHRRGSDNGVGHVGHHPQPLLSAGVPFFAFSHSIAEAPLGLTLTLRDPALWKGSIGQVFDFDRSLDDVKTPIEPARPQGILGRPWG